MLQVYKKNLETKWESSTDYHSLSALTVANGSESAASYGTPTADGIGSYVAHGLGIDEPSTTPVVSIEVAKSAGSRSNSIIDSTVGSGNAQGAYMLSPIKTSPRKSPSSFDVSFIKATENLRVAGTSSVHQSPESAAKNITASPGLVSPSTTSEQTSFSSQDSSDPNRFCATAADRYSANTDVVDCYCSLSSWFSSYDPYSSSYLPQIGTNNTGLIHYSTLTTEVGFNSSTITPTDLAPYTLCDGWARVNASRVSETITYTTTYQEEYYDLAVGHPFAPAPTCTIPSAGCVWLYYNASLPGGLANDFFDQALGILCGYPAHVGQPCLVRGGPIKLLYFPEPSDPDDICDTTNSTNLPKENSNLMLTSHANQSLLTAQTLGTTFTSGTAYISISTLYAYHDGFDDRVGPTFSNYILPLASTQVHTICYNFDGPKDAPGAQLGSPLDFRDLNYPVPGSAYSCASGCGIPAYTTNSSPCTIFDDYRPILALPTMLTQLAPEWASCSLWDEVLNNFWYDPPTTLVPQLAAATPVDTFLPITTKPMASPIASPTSPAQKTDPTRLLPPAPSPVSLSDSRPRSSATTSHSEHVPHTSTPAQSSNLELSSLPVIISPLPNSADPGSDNSAPAAVSYSKAPLASVDPDSSNSVPVEQLSNLGGFISSIIAGSSVAGNRPNQSPDVPAASAAAAITNSGDGTFALSKAAPSPSAGISRGSVAPTTLDTDPAPDTEPTGAVDSHPTFMDPSDPGDVIIDGQTFDPGQPLLIDGHTASIASDGAVVLGSSTIPISPPAAASGSTEPNAQRPGVGSDPQHYAIFSIGSSAFTAAPVPGSSNAFTIGRSTLEVGGAPAVIGGETVSAMPSGIVVSGSEGARTVHVLPATGAAANTGAVKSGAVLAIGPHGSLVTAVPEPGSNSVYKVGGTYFTVGGAPAMINGYTVSADQGGVVVKSSNEAASSISFSSINADLGAFEEGIIFTANGHTYTGEEASIGGKEAVVISDAGPSRVMTMILGDSPITTQGMTLFAASSGIIVDGSTITLSSSIAGEVEATITLGGDAIIVSALPGYITRVLVDETTITEGGLEAIINGQTISLGHSGLVVGGKGSKTTFALDTESRETGTTTETETLTNSGGASSSVDMPVTGATTAGTTTAGAGRIKSGELSVWSMSLVSVVICGLAIS